MQENIDFTQNELSWTINFIFEIIYEMTIYNFIAGNKMLFNKYYLSSYICCY